jgi:YVTN family beta-propeller protein
MTPVSGTSRIRILFSAFIAIVGLSVLGGCASGVKVAPTPTTTTTTPPATTPPAPPVTVTPGAATPMALAYNPVTNLFYVANGSGNTVSVVDGTSFKNLDTITVESNPSAIAVNSTTNMVYVVNFGAQSVTVIDGTTNAITATLSGGSGQIAINTVTNRIYILDARGSQNDNVFVLDGTNNAVVGSLQIGGNASSVAVNTKTNTVYVTNGLTLVAIDGSTNKVTGSIPVPSAPIADPAHPPIAGTTAVAVDETTNTVFFANTGGDNTVDVVNCDTLAVTATVAVGNSPDSVAVNPLTHLVYVANELDKTITVIDETTNTATATISLTDHPQGIVVNPATNLLYVAMDQSVGVVNLATNTPQQ